VSCTGWRRSSTAGLRVAACPMASCTTPSRTRSSLRATSLLTLWLKVWARHATAEGLWEANQCMAAEQLASGLLTCTHAKLCVHVDHGWITCSMYSLVICASCCTCYTALCLYSHQCFVGCQSPPTLSMSQSSCYDCQCCLLALNVGIDQTRGWFYTLMVLSTALFDKPAFKSLVCNGLILAEDGKKMSKRLRNYPVS